MTDALFDSIGLIMLDLIDKDINLNNLNGHFKMELMKRYCLDLTIVFIEI